MLNEINRNFIKTKKNFIHIKKKKKLHIFLINTCKLSRKYNILFVLKRKPTLVSRNTNICGYQGKYKRVLNLTG